MENEETFVTQAERFALVLVALGQLRAEVRTQDSLPDSVQARWLRGLGLIITQTMRIGVNEGISLDTQMAQARALTEAHTICQGLGKANG